MRQKIGIALMLAWIGLGTLPAEGREAMESLAVLKDYRAARVSSYDRSGGNADGQNILPEPGKTVTLADLEGPGAVTHIWVTIASGEEHHLRKLVLRMYWDGESTPSVETPIGDFFGQGHGQYYPIQSQPIATGTNNGLNCFWLMPFSKSARITLTHEGEKPLAAFYYYIDYRVYDRDKPGETARIDQMGRFHAQYHQERPTTKGKEYTILSAQGRGHYVGCNLCIQLNSGGWWGEGDDRIFVDGEVSPSLHGTGSEDYFCGAWCYGDAFSSLYFGCPLRGKHRKDALWNVYRYHIEDPIPFKESIEVLIEAIHQSRAADPPDDYSSVAYWYQTEPHQAFPPLPPVSDRLPRPEDSPGFQIEGALEGEQLKVLEKSSANLHCAVQEMSGFGEGWSGGAHLWFIPKAKGDSIVIEFEVAQKGFYQVDGYFTRASDYGRFDVHVGPRRINRKPVDGFHDRVAPSGKIPLGKKYLSAGKHKMKFVSAGKNPESEGYMIGIDCLKLTLLKD